MNIPHEVANKIEHLMVNGKLAKALKVLEGIEEEASKTPIVHVKAEELKMIKWLNGFLWDLNCGVTLMDGTLVTRGKK